MTNVFTRMIDSVTADIHEFLDKKEKKNPVSSLNHYLRQSEKEKEKVKHLIERQYQLRNEFMTEYHKADDLAKKRLHQANIAKKADEQDLYEHAMREYESYHERATRMKEAREEAVGQIDRLERNYEEMKHKLKEMNLKRMELMGRENIARAKKKMNDVFDDTGSQSFARFNELDRYIKGIEEKVNRDYYHTTFDSKIAALERELHEVADENIQK
ncbi:MAG TPA: PspA/IM30 family protein [Bacillota bacterium]|nr:PspA/IM30 family protein [Bacillota bacterium]